MTHCVKDIVSVQAGKKRKDGSDPCRVTQVMTMALSSLLRSPNIIVELSTRHGTSGMCMHAGPDHSCVVGHVTLQQATTKAPEALD